MMRFDRFTQKAQEAAMRSLEILQHYKHSQVDTEHIFLALVQQKGGTVPQLLEKLGATVEVVARKLEATLEAAPKSSNAPYGGMATAQVFITPRLKRVMDVANEEANKLQDEYISTEHIFLAIASERNTPAANILRDAGVSKDRLYAAVEELRGGQKVTEPNAESKYQVLEKYGRDLTAVALEGKLDLADRPGTGDTASDAGALSAQRTTQCLSARLAWARRLSSKGWPSASPTTTCAGNLSGKRVISWTWALVNARRARALKACLDEPKVTARSRFIDELHTVVGVATPAPLTARGFKPASPGRSHCIGATLE